MCVPIHLVFGAFAEFFCALYVTGVPDCISNNLVTSSSQERALRPPVGKMHLNSKVLKNTADSITLNEILFACLVRQILLGSQAWLASGSGLLIKYTFIWRSSRSCCLASKPPIVGKYVTYVDYLKME
jgi:hypothetical protein